MSDNILAWPSDRGTRSLPVALLRGAMWLLLSFSPTTVAAQAIRGTILDRATQDPIPNASVLILNSDSSLRQVVLSDSQGHFALSSPVGGFLLRVERLGFASVWSQPLQLAATDTADFFIQLPPQPVELAGITALHAEESNHGARRQLDHYGFNTRKGAGWGRFLTANQIEERNATQVAELLTGLPGLMAYPGARGSIIQGMVRAVRSGSDPTCDPTVFLNFRPIPLRLIDQLAPPRLLRGIEYYRDAISAPIEFQPPRRDQKAQCPVIVLWTYLGPE